jgi:hypothetical protein
VHHFRKRGSIEAMIPDAFHAQGWPRLIADPLPAQDRPGNRKRHLRITVNNLSRVCKPGGLCFYIADSGKAVGWKRHREALS